MDAIISNYKNNLMTAVLICVFTVVLMSQAGAEAKTLVTGKYASSTGGKIILNLHIRNPAPANLIVEQYLSPQNSVINIGPKPIKRSPGKIKWLFRNTRSGRLSISIKLRSPLRGQIRCVVRYRDPVRGNFVEFHISP